MFLGWSFVFIILTTLSDFTNIDNVVLDSWPDSQFRNSEQTDSYKIHECCTVFDESILCSIFHVWVVSIHRGFTPKYFMRYVQSFNGCNRRFLIGFEAVKLMTFFWFLWCIVRWENAHQMQFYSHPEALWYWQRYRISRWMDSWRDRLDIKVNLSLIPEKQCVGKWKGCRNYDGEITFLYYSTYK